MLLRVTVSIQERCAEGMCSPTPLVFSILYMQSVKLPKETRRSGTRSILYMQSVKLPKETRRSGTRSQFTCLRSSLAFTTENMISNEPFPVASCVISLAFAACLAGVLWLIWQPRGVGLGFSVSCGLSCPCGAARGRGSLFIPLVCLRSICKILCNRSQKSKWSLQLQATNLLPRIG